MYYLDFLFMCGGFYMVFNIALCDMKDKMIPDMLTSAVWIAGAYFALFNPFVAFVIVATFALLFSLNSAFVSIKQLPMFSWGDVLLIPPVAGIVAVGGVFWVIVLGVCVLAGLVRSFAARKEEALGLYVCVAYTLCFAVQVFSSRISP